MTYYRDLTRHAYAPHDESDGEMLNVGWPAPGHGCRTGIVDERVVEALSVLSAGYDNQMRGIHPCGFCDTDRPVVLGGPALETEVWLGSAEIRVRGADGTLHTAPNLVIHYITRHRYCPPEEFCRAAVRTAGIDTSGQLTSAD
ncbi:DUF7919 family protein [Streptomyces griseoloalbus]|uniref:DUF7919 domain-containing protein n=1 Tax=Streptomyces griseoloalbus TaxID=67303 RepID=A0A7W8BQF8_9ACTN|nr:hypothetical protein [Streptomyces albaduncus]MBB5126208.1 hypothetical protein [Streptomyces albaduncus]GGW36600.1 hypothetical protein GCM10010340_13060 [Streptomyces albaduncus]